uniref:copper chaperone PCu(A)C n=1 Tax=Ningiella ruwaisensis TaxID=2364274 RepID=UPI0014473AC4|nr:copper chaperone PCu(A)C [Ningiella ruwaisensis]
MFKFLAVFLFLWVASAAAFADDHAQKSMADSLLVEKVWARETFKMAKAGAAYASFSNQSESPIVLVGASVEPEIATMVELHTTKMENGMMRMQELEEGVTIDANESVMFQPGGMHFMLMGLAGPLEAGKNFKLTLHFEDNSSRELTVDIRDMSNRSAN